MERGRACRIPMPQPSIDLRAHAEAQLRLSEERFRHIFENAAVGIAEVALDGRFTTVNDTLCAITGYPREELLERTFQDLTHPDDLAADQALAARLAAGEVHQYTIEKRYIRRDGSVVFVNLSGSALRDAAGEALCYIAIVEDISERKAAEEAVRHSEQRFRSVFQHAATGIAVTLLDGTFIQCNPAYEGILGYSEEELRAVNFADLVHADDRAANMRDVARLLAGEITHIEIENRYLRKDGAVVWVHKFVALLYDADGRATNLMALVTDVTGQRHLQEAQREALRQKDAFIAVLAHELRNPLAPIRTAVALLSGLGPPDAVLVHARNVIERQVAHMSRLIDDLLDVSRLSRSELRLQRGPTSLAAVVGSALEQVQPLFSRQRQTLRLDGVEATIVIDADAARLTQVVGNLLNNAAKFSPPDSEVQLSIGQDGDAVLIRVRDRGVGIPTEQLQRVFDLFAQTDNARAMSGGGLGIGLALARQLVALHGGTITASSPGPGLGSEFVVRLPNIAPDAPVPAPAPAETAAWPSLGCRVLVADDNVDAADMLGLLFTDVGCEVRLVHDGESAVHEAERFQPDVAVLDIGMPGMDGYDVCRRIRQTTWGASSVVVALTGWGQDVARRQSAMAGFDHHFVKPVDPLELAAFVRDALAQLPRR